MGILVSVAIVWLALIVLVVLWYSLGPPARRLLWIRAEVEQAVEAIRREAQAIRQQTTHQLQNVEHPIDHVVPKYQEARRTALPGAPDHRWGESELAHWKQKEEAQRSHSLKLRNLFALVAWNLVISVTCGLGAWAYYQNVQSKVRPQVKVPASTRSISPQP